MIKDPLVSVVTISYNQSRFLRECIDSVLHQTYKNIQYIIQDPGSNDGSRELIASYGDKFSAHFECDNGPADGLNRGFARATGEIFCYLNSDDVFLPHAIERAVEQFMKYPEVDVLTGHAELIDESSRVLRKLYSDRFNLVLRAYGCAISIQPSTFFRSSAFRKADGFNLSNKSNWDGELLIDMYMAGAKISVLNNVLSQYRVHQASITGTARLKAAHDDFQRRMFKKIMGRDPNKFDQILSPILRYLKHLTSPAASLERVLHGPAFSRKQ